MRPLILLVAVILCLIALPAMALPDRAMHVTYFDSSGNEIGTWDAVCYSGYYLNGQTSDNFTLEIWEPCNELAPLSCQDVGMGELAGCSGVGWCVSTGYADGFANDLVPNCGGVCRYGEPAPCCANDPNCYIHSKQMGRLKRPVVLRAVQSLPGRYAPPPSLMWRTRSKNEPAFGGRFLAQEPSFALQRWHAYLRD